MKQDAKTTYAQSSDIKSRTYLEYRKDMKEKAIAELEILPWLRDKLKEKDSSVFVEKSGGDRFIWFLRRGGVTREPDFVAEHQGGKVEHLEFQYAKKELKAYDFKISKITPYDRALKKKVPKRDTQILYLVKPSYEFAFLEPEWIVAHSKETTAAAWGNARVYRVPADILKGHLQKDKKLKKSCSLIDIKIAMLNFQHEAIEKEEERLSQLLQQVIDEEKILKIMPKTLDGFFKVCFVLNHIEKNPVNANLWLIYLLTFLDQELNTYELFQLIYSLDFLYPKIELKENELKKFIQALKQIENRAKNYAKTDGSFQSDKKIAPLEETRYSLFTLNILEDLIQDILFYYGEKKIDLEPITRIYQSLPYLEETFRFITS